MGQNKLNNFVTKYQSVITSPLMQSAAIAAITVPIMYGLRKPFYRLLRRRVQDPRISNFLFGVSPRDADASVDQLQESWLGRHGLPLAIGSILPLIALGSNIVTEAPGWGLTQWTPKAEKKLDEQENENRSDVALDDSREKKNSLSKIASLWQDYGYQPQLDLTKSINRRAAIDMLNNNPYMAAQDQYARNFGTSIITAAPSIGNMTTLGGIYDSAQSKFNNKLSFQGVASKAVKGVVSGALAGMFTDVIGTALGMPSKMSAGLANTVGIGKALHSILT